jgi:hypothetical protein
MADINSTLASGSNSWIYTRAFGDEASDTHHFSGSVFVSGTLVANAYKVTTFTTADVYSSGSSVFGDTTDDIHAFTGSVLIAGALSSSLNISASAYYGDGSNLSGVGGGSITTVAGTSYIVGSGETFIAMTSTSARTIELITATTATEVTIADAGGNAETNAITITASAGDSIQGVSGSSIETNYGTATFMAIDGTNWIIKSVN